MKPRYYLAYGMNANVAGMKQRCPTAVPMGRVRVHHHQLVFRGVADAVRRRGYHMWAALWTLQPSDEAALDRLEGYPHGYGKRMLTVTFNGEQVQAMVYFMQNTHGEALPGSYYEGLLVKGYRAFGIPQVQITNAKKRAMMIRQFDRTEQVGA